MIIGSQVSFSRMPEGPTPFQDQIRQQVQARLADSMRPSVQTGQFIPVEGDTAQIASIRIALVKLNAIQAQHKAFIEQSQKVKTRPMNALEKFRAFADPIIKDVMDVQIRKQQAARAYLAINAAVQVSRFRA